MSDDLVKKLRSQIGDDVQDYYLPEALFRAAADRIETSEEQNLRLWGMVHDLRKEVAISDALLISEAEASLARLARAEKAEAERNQAWKMVAEADTRLGQALGEAIQDKADNARLREAVGILEDALQEAGDDYPGSAMQEWCQQQVRTARAALNTGKEPSHE